MRTTLRRISSGLADCVLASCFLLGVAAVPVASAPRLLWNTEPLHG